MRATVYSTSGDPSDLTVETVPDPSPNRARPSFASRPARSTIVIATIESQLDCDIVELPAVGHALSLATDGQIDTISDFFAG